MPSELTKHVFAVVDARDAAPFSRLFAPDGRMIFGNAEPQVGPAAIEAGLSDFYGTIKELHHTLVNEWVVGPDTICELSVRYVRLDSKTVTIPAVTTWHLDDHARIDSYRVFIDLTPVFA
ncbi:nuclear transport factor 2 family protein [Actinopolymorpha pittospori]|uniref:Ketosteroid isomerase-like protein n=1 Tax=Actinopolymorpha pittospori TaxID=648752 RepID=A0A927R6M6_9ACTN|nr:nuclear transport factor 2 family protein [Actinopolymorpha pittospori]MBE1603289.1 ketosteroid isomerase-like protein [Actinopolymorpha pittospori]